MKKILLAACAILLTVSSVFGQNYMKRYKVSDLHGIRACSIFDVTIEEGNIDFVQVITDKDSMEGSLKNLPLRAILTSAFCSHVLCTAYASATFSFASTYPSKSASMYY